MKAYSSCIEFLEARIAPAFAPIFELSSLDGLNGFSLSGVAADDGAGGSVSDAGDVNGDGFGDVIVGARQAAGDAGASYIVFGKANGFAPNLNLAALNGSNGFKLSGLAARDYFGDTVSAAGDVNGDGFDDLIVGTFPGTRNTCASYVIFGKVSGFAANLSLSTLNGSNGFKLVVPGDYGAPSSAAGDVNGDGFDDLIVGAPLAGPGGTYSGASYVVFGKAGAFPASMNLSALDGINGFKLSGVAPRDVSGASVSNAGDVNGDGFADVIIGAHSADSGGSDSGTSYVVFGKAGGFPASSSLSTLNGSNGFTVIGAAAGDYSGSSVSDAGDINGDGFGDLIIGAHRADPNGSASGSSYVIFGKPSGFTADLNLATLDGSNGFKLSGTAIRDYSGKSVSGAGDVNGDGFDDLIIGAYGADPNGSYSGASFVIFGKASGFVADVNLSTLDGTNGLKLNGVAVDDQSGGSVSDAGDVNGDGIGDLIIGATGVDSNGSLSGASYVVFGRAPASPTISIGDATAAEGNAEPGVLTFALTLSSPSTEAVTVQMSTLAETADAESDFTALLNQTVQFAPGETSKMVAIHFSGDTLHEVNETFSVVLSNASGATIGDGTGSGTIINDDAPPLMSITGASVVEGNSGASQLLFTVTLSAASGVATSVNIASADGTALAGTDYTALTLGTLAFAPGETTKTVAINVLGDINAEFNETFSFMLANASNAVIEDGIGLGTILNDDVILHGKQKATFTDVDGDHVIIKVNKGTLKVEHFTLVPSGNGAQLALVNFRNESQFAGANLSISVKGAIGTVAGAGLVNVGHINASGIDLGKVAVKGDLGQIDAGNDADRQPGVLSLRANSLGLHGTDTQLPGGSMTSDIVGALKTFQVVRGMHHATLLVSGPIGAATVGGDWIASNLAAGATAGFDGFFGTEDDAPMSAPTASSIARIASILIKGTVVGTEGGTDHFGFVAQHIAAFKVGGAKLSLIRGERNDLAGLALGSSGDITVREVA